MFMFILIAVALAASFHCVYVMQESLFLLFFLYSRSDVGITNLYELSESPNSSLFIV